jgi:predicted HD phosphohydrolase
MDTNNVFDKISKIYEERGGERYMIEEPITQTQHAIQTALQVELMGGSKELQVAALLHDIGHLVQYDAPLNPSDGKDDKHEVAGAGWLSVNGFGPDVYEPVRWHVAAKRYLCAMKPEYKDDLTPASLKSLELQGGPMSAGDCVKFQNRRNFKEAVMLRSADDRGKSIDVASLPEFSSFRALVLSVIKSK